MIGKGRTFSSAISNLKSAIPFLFYIALAGCAAPSPPLPPSLELPTPVTDLKAVRKGNNVLLTWTLPQETTDGEGIRFHGPTRICRSLTTPPKTPPSSPTNPPTSPTVSPMTECGTPAAELVSSEIEIASTKPSTNVPQRVSARYADPLPADWTRDPAATITYAIESLNTNHRGAGLSNRVHVPAASTEAPPADFTAQLTAEGVVLRWSGPLLSIPGNNIVPYYFYRVFRSANDAPVPTLVGEIQQGTQAQMRLVDRGFAWEKTYNYRINLTTRVARGGQPCPAGLTPLPVCEETVDVEGEDSAPATIVAHDTFPPAVPSALQAVFSGAGQKPFIDLTWNANTDADLAGYNVYRNEGTAAPARITTELAKAPAFRDENVASGRTYFYSVAAVDARGNESARSEEASEQVP